MVEEQEELGEEGFGLLMDLIDTTSKPAPVPKPASFVFPAGLPPLWTFGADFYRNAPVLPLTALVPCSSSAQTSSQPTTPIPPTITPPTATMPLPVTTAAPLMPSLATTILPQASSRLFA